MVILSAHESIPSEPMVVYTVQAARRLMVPVCLYEIGY